MKTNRSIAWRQRGQATLLYCGLTPLYYVFPRRRDCPFLEHHFRQASAIIALVLAVAAIFVLSIATLSYVLVFHRSWYEDLHLEVYVLGALRKLFLALAVFWLFGLLMALLGGARQMPIVYRLGARRWVARTAAFGLLAIYLALIALLPLAAHASSLVPQNRDVGEVYMVYEDNGVFPRWLFALAFYPMAQAARQVYGPDAPVLIEISREAVENSVAHGRVVYVGSHGTSRGLMLRDDWLLPGEFKDAPKNPGLRLVYLSGCDSGDQRDAWEKAFAPAEVITYDRLSAVLEHVWWLWFRGPDVVRESKNEEHHAG